MSFGMRCALFATALLLALAPAQAQESWATVRSSDGALQYEAPGTFKTETYTDADRGARYRQTVFTSTSETTVVMGMYTLYDDTFVAVDLNSVATEFMKELKAVITGYSLRPYRRGPGDAIPGVFVSGVTEGLECDLWVIGDGRFNYLLSACSQRGDSQTVVKQRILGSVKITDIRTDADWTKVDDDNGYHFQVPGKPKIELNRKTGDRMYVGRDGGILALAGSTSVPLPPASNAAIDEALLDAAAAGFMDGNRMKLKSRELKPYTLPSGKIMPGILFRSSDQLTGCTVRMVLGQGRAYFIAGCVAQGYEAEAKVQRVMDSMVIDEK